MAQQAAQHTSATGSLSADAWCGRVFLFIACPALALLCFLIPPFEAPDEPAHFLRIVSLGRAQWTPQVQRHDPGAGGAPTAGGSVDSAAGEMALAFVPAPGRRYRPADVYGNSHTPPAFSAGYARHSNTAIYPPPLYLPATIAVAIARRAALPVLWWLYLGRLANAAVGVALLFWSIRRSDAAAPAFLLAATLPITLFQVSSLSSDAALLPLVLAYASCVRRIARGDQLGLRANLLLAFAMVVIAVGKVAYLPLVLLPAAMEWLVQGSWTKRARLYALIGGLAGMLWLGWAWIVHDKVFSMYPGVHVDPGAQLRGLVEAPIRATRLFAGTIARDLPSMSFGLVGAQLGWNDLRLPKPFVVMSMAAWLIAALLRPRGKEPSARMFLIGGLAALLCYIAIYLLLYLQFNAVGATSIEGVQARYLTPLAFLLVALLPPLGMRPIGGTAARIAVVGWTAASTLFVLGSVLLRYWAL